MLTSLDSIKSYTHPAVIRRFQRDFPAKAAQAEQLFKDLVLFFWASKKHALDKQARPNDDALNFVFIMDETMKDIDHMWHVFLLYTKDYMEFCENNFGEYLHHLPDVVPTFQKGTFEFGTNLSKFLSYVYDILGEEVVRRWFALDLEGNPESVAPVLALA